MCDNCSYSTWLEAMEELLEDPAYSSSHFFIQEIYEWVEDHQHITDKQIQALKNIQERGH